MEENVRLQLEHLREFPFVKRATKENKLNVHGWVYDMSTGEIKAVKNA